MYVNYNRNNNVLSVKEEQVSISSTEKQETRNNILKNEIIYYIQLDPFF